MLYMTPLGIQEATCALIGNCIGANNVPLAQRFFSLIFKINGLTVIILSLLILFARKQIAQFYTGNAEVLDIMVPFLILTSFTFLFDGT